MGCPDFIVIDKVLIHLVVLPGLLGCLMCCPLSANSRETSFEVSLAKRKNPVLRTSKIWPFVYYVEVRGKEKTPSLQSSSQSQGFINNNIKCSNLWGQNPESRTQRLGDAKIISRLYKTKQDSHVTPPSIHDHASKLSKPSPAPHWLIDTWQAYSLHIYIVVWHQLCQDKAKILFIVC